jgi:hypothetical protein
MAASGVRSPRDPSFPYPLGQENILHMNENFSLIVMCLFLLGSLAFLAEQLTSYH